MNNVVHFELPAKNMKRAKKFYETAFGWKVDKYMESYFMAYTGPVDKKYMPIKTGVINGGIQKKDKSIGMTRFVVAVPDVDEAIKNVVKSGGKVLKKKFKIEDMMLYAVVADSEGNEVGVSQYLRKR